MKNYLFDFDGTLSEIKQRIGYTAVHKSLLEYVYFLFAFLDHNNRIRREKSEIMIYSYDLLVAVHRKLKLADLFKITAQLYWRSKKRAHRINGRLLVESILHL